MWEQSKVLFVTVNVPGGSNNDADNWFGAPRTSAAQTDEIAHRTGADLRWLDRAFAQAHARRRRSGRDHPAGRHVGPRRQGRRPHRQLRAVHRQHRQPHAGVRQARPALQRRLAHYRSDNPLKQNQACVFEAGSDTFQRPTRQPWTSRMMPGQPPEVQRPELPPGRRARQHGAVSMGSPDHQARHERAGGIECLRSLQLGALPRRVVIRPTAADVRASMGIGCLGLSGDDQAPSATAPRALGEIARERFQASDDSRRGRSGRASRRVPG